MFPIFTPLINCMGTTPKRIKEPYCSFTLPEVVRGVTPPQHYLI
tara:strand:- start:1294 stop:1425 length:132 start_codon:yes stop_codon:yes gene_type:complete